MEALTYGSEVNKRVFFSCL